MPVIEKIQNLWKYNPFFRAGLFFSVTRSDSWFLKLDRTGSLKLFLLTEIFFVINSFCTLLDIEFTKIIIKKVFIIAIYCSNGLLLRKFVFMYGTVERWILMVKLLFSQQYWHVNLLSVVYVSCLFCQRMLKCILI